MNTCVCVCVCVCTHACICMNGTGGTLIDDCHSTEQIIPSVIMLKINISSPVMTFCYGSFKSLLYVLCSVDMCASLSLSLCVCVCVCVCVSCHPYI